MLLLFPCIHSEDRTVELDGKRAASGAGIHKPLQGIASANALGFIRAVDSNPTAIPEISPPHPVRFPGTLNILQLDPRNLPIEMMEPFLNRSSLLRERMN